MKQYEEIIELYVSEETKQLFEQLLEEEHQRWIEDAQSEKFYSNNTREDKCRYIGKVTLVHLYQLRKEVGIVWFPISNEKSGYMVGDTRIWCPININPSTKNMSFANIEIEQIIGQII